MPVIFLTAASIACALLFLAFRDKVLYVSPVDSPESLPVEFIGSITELIPEFVKPDTLPVESASFPSDSVLDKLRELEGFSAVPYADPVGQSRLYSIGYGYQLRAGEYYKNMTKEIANTLLYKVVSEVTQSISRNVKVALNQNQYDALTLFVYNVGQPAFYKSTLLRKLNDGDYLGAANEFQRWTLAGGKHVAALTQRRAYERDLFNAG